MTPLDIKAQYVVHYSFLDTREEMPLRYSDSNSPLIPRIGEHVLHHEAYWIVLGVMHQISAPIPESGPYYVHRITVTMKVDPEKN